MLKREHPFLLFGIETLFKGDSFSKSLQIDKHR